MCREERGSAVGRILEARASMTQLRSLSSQGWRDCRWESCLGRAVIQKGVEQWGSRGCPNRSPNPAWCHPLCLFALIGTHQGRWENLVEGGKFRGVFKGRSVLLVSRTG